MTKPLDLDELEWKREVPPVEERLCFFAEQGIDLEQKSVCHDLSSGSPPMGPDTADLYRLYRMVRDTRRTTVLEFGCGWSTWILAEALRHNARDWEVEVAGLRRHNPFEIHTVDHSGEWLATAASRIPEATRSRVFLYESRVLTTEWNGRIATRYEHLPLVNPDFIYVDGPDPESSVGQVYGWSPRHPDLMPMSADLLAIEPFLIPGTIVVVDGRTANARFLRDHFQRRWRYEFDRCLEQHSFVLIEEPLGKINEAQIAFYLDRSVDR